ncbi:MAG: hypothetical protein RL404_1977 [Pseudomonadota bacterium]|jgi:hypothetical protein
MDRQSPTLGRRASPQNVNDALQAMNGAFREHKNIDIDAEGTVRPSRSEEGRIDFRMMFSRLFSEHLDPGATLHEKMVAEVSTRMEIDGERAAYIVNKRIGAVPDIRQAIGQRDLAPIEDRWTRLARELSNRQEEMVLMRRSAELEDIKQAFPVELGLSNLDNQVVSLKRSFSDDAQAQIIRAYVSLTDDPVDPGTGLSAQFVADARRAVFTFVDDQGKEQSYDGAPAEVVIEALRKFARDDQALAGTLSKMANQRALAGVFEQLNADFPTPAGEPHAARERVRLPKTTASEVCIYRMERGTDDSIIVTSDYYSRPHKLLVSPTRSVLVNRWDGWEASAGPANFGMHCHCALRLSEPLMTAGRIKPTYVEPPYGEFRIAIAWQQMETAQAKS